MEQVERPEQRLQEKLDHNKDIWGMDMLLHAFLTSTLDGGKRDREYY
jgi:hypothetical protein